MRTGAIHLAKKLGTTAPRPDVLLVSDYVNLPALVGLRPELAGIPSAVYFLENQLTYPTREGRPRDFEFAAINIATCVAATRCVFCSQDQLDAMLEAALGFLKRDESAESAESEAIVDAIRSKSCVIPIGVDLPKFDRARVERADRSGKPLRIIWPHRFEHDKNPDDFFEVVTDLKNEGLDFELAVVGKAYRDLPPSMEQAKTALAGRIVEFGFLSGDDYPSALAASDVVVSTAFQETQGIACIEAIRAGCDPLLPARLSYPEVLGLTLSEKHLYTSTGDLRRRLRWMIRNPERVRKTSHHFGDMDRFGWDVVSGQFDRLFLELS